MHTLNTVITLNSDVDGLVYISASVEKSVMATWLSSLKQVLDPIDFFAFTLKQQVRDNHTHHLTVINPLEFPCIDRSDVEKIIGYQASVNIYGIGKIKEDSNEVYFLVCGSKEVNNIRKFLGLKEADLHITLGFKSHDVFDQPKNKAALISPYNVIEKILSNSINE